MVYIANVTAQLAIDGGADPRHVRKGQSYDPSTPGREWVQRAVDQFPALFDLADPVADTETADGRARRPRRSRGE